MKDMYFTITGCNHYLGNEFMEKGMKVKLKKEPDNEFDSEAILGNTKTFDSYQMNVCFDENDKVERTYIKLNP